MNEPQLSEEILSPSMISEENVRSWRECRVLCLGQELFEAIKQNQAAEVDRLLTKGASPKTVCSKTKTSALHLAVTLNSKQIVQLLLEKEASTVLRDGEGRQPIHLAAALGNLPLLKTLLDHDQDQLLNSPIILSEYSRLRNQLHDNLRLFSIRDELLEILNILENQPKDNIDHWKNINRSLMTISELRNRLEHDPKFALIKDGLLTDLKPFETVLKKEFGLLNTTKETTKLRDKTTVSTDVIYVNSDVQDLILQVPIIIEGSTPLHITVEYLHKDCTEELVARGASKDILDSWSVTALHTIGRVEARAKGLGKIVEKKIIDQSNIRHSSLDLNLLLPETDQNKNTKSLKDALGMFTWLASKGFEYFCSTIEEKKRLLPMKTTALHSAIYNDNTSMIEFIVKKFGYETLLLKNDEGQTGIHLALKMRKFQLLEPTLASNKIINEVDEVEQVVNSRDLRGVSPLHIAARNCGLSVVNLLLAKRADAMAHSDDGSTVLHFAAENPDNSVLYRLLDSDICWKELINSKDSNDQTPIFRSVAKGLMHSTSLLVECGAEIALQVYECTSWKEEASKNLLVNKWIPSAFKQWLKQSEQFKQDRMGRLGYMTLLHVAAMRGHADVLQLLLEDKRMDDSLKSTTWKGNTALHFAVAAGSEACVQSLVKDKFQVDVENANFQTPLCLSVLRDRNDILQMLIPHSKLNISSRQFKLIFFIAAFYGYTDCLQTIICSILEEPGSYFEAKNLVRIPWPVLVVYGDFSILKYLLEDGCKMQKQTSDSTSVPQIPLICGHFNSLPNLQILKSILNERKTQQDENLLLHPFIETFLRFKWRVLRPLIWLYVVIYFVYVAAVTEVAIHYYITQLPILADHQSTISDLGLASLYVTAVRDLLWLRHCIRLRLWKEIWKQKSNSILSITSMSLSCLVLLEDHPKPLARYVTAATVMLCWLDVFSQMALRSFKVHLFFAVAKNILQVLFRFSAVFLGFAVAFLICFRLQRPFENFWKALVKVVVMTVDLDYNAIKEAAPEYLIEDMFVGTLFLVFVVLVNLTLMNLLVGLSVSDTVSMEKNVKAECIANQIVYLNFFESVLFQLSEAISFCCRRKVNLVRFFDNRLNTETRTFHESHLNANYLPFELMRRLMSHVNWLEPGKNKSSQLNLLEQKLLGMSVFNRRRDSIKLNRVK